MRGRRASNTTRFSCASAAYLCTRSSRAVKRSCSATRFDGVSSIGGECDSRRARRHRFDCRPATRSGRIGQLVTIFSPSTRPHGARSQRMLPELEELGDRAGAAPESRDFGTSARRHPGRSRTWPSGRPRSARRHRPAGGAGQIAVAKSRLPRDRSRATSVPEAGHPCWSRPVARRAAACRRRRSRQVLVEPWAEDDARRRQVARGSLELDVEPAERRAGIATHEHARVIAAARVEPRRSSITLTSACMPSSRISPETRL